MKAVYCKRRDYAKPRLKSVVTEIKCAQNIGHYLVIMFGSHILFVYK